MEQKTNELHAQLSLEAKQRYQSIKRLQNMTSNGFSQLNELNSSHVKAREEADSALFKRIDEESASFMEVLEDQKKAIGEAEEAMLEILKEMVTKIKQDLDLERKEREENEETLLSLLEDTCQKLGTACGL